MASYTCDEGDGPAFVMITFVETGDVSALCVGHFEAHARAFIEQIEQARAAAEEATEAPAPTIADEAAPAAAEDAPEATGDTFREAAAEKPQEPPKGGGGKAARQ